MPLKPGNYKNEYNVSDIKSKPSSNNRGYGYDHSQDTDNIIYISSMPLERTIAFKAFIESFKLNLTREQEVGSDLDKISQAVIVHRGDLSYDLTLNIPAHSTNDSKNNIAKIAELQRLISLVEDTSSQVGNSTIYSAISNKTKIDFPSFKVWFKNLISIGNVSNKMPLPSNCDFDDIDKYGFPCVIQDVSYEPDLEQGFFDFQDYLYPKNIKLTLKLEYILDELTMTRLTAATKGEFGWAPIYGFKINGQYEDEDGCFFPFGIKVKNQKVSKKVISGPAYLDGGFSQSVTAEYTTSEINVIDWKNYNDSYLFISLPKAGESINRWVVFQSFFDQFSRTMGTNLPLSETKNSNIGKIFSASEPSSPKPINYKIKINVPSKNLEEAKKNCAKVQYLFRMFLKQNIPMTEDEVFSDNVLTNQSTFISSINRKLMFYSPSFIEKPGASVPKIAPSDFENMYANSIQMSLGNLSLDISIDEGFFEDKGFLYPKAFSIDMEIIYTEGDLQRNYSYNDVEGTYKMIESSGFKNAEHLFPYNRTTSTIKIGG